MKSVDDVAFSKGGNALFLVMSPFQFLCALEAVAAFEIKEYLMEFVFVKEYKHRNDQMQQMAKENQIPYVINYTDEIDIGRLYGTTCQMPEKKDRQFSRIFIGDYLSKHLYVEAFKYSKKDSIILFLDDGTSTICLLKGVPRIGDLKRWIDKYNYVKHSIGSRVIFNRIKRRFQENNVYITDCFFTMYSNIRKKYHLYPNKFKRLKSECNNEKKEHAIFIIGTVIEDFASSVLQEDCHVLEGIVWGKISKVREKYPKETIIYIPHPRDNNMVIPEFCKILSIDYRILDESVESFLLHSRYRVKSIFGFGSTALGVLKFLFPDIAIVNYSIVKGETSFMYNAIYEYYASIGIRNETVALMQEEASFFVDFFQNLYSFGAFVCSKIHKRIK